ncbi:MAG: hypothetical protein K8T25_07355 [Planctomycetia bacterium]|nr:hypothetical protein [Planctomycetia bacterium]
MRPPLQLLAIPAIMACCAAFALAAPTTKDAATDVLRQAAEKAVKDGKYGDAVALLTKITEGEAGRYQDYMLLGKANEKLGKEREAAAAYRNVVEVLPESPEKREERVARIEAKQKLATLDVIGRKIDVFTKDAEKKVSDLIRDADKAGDWDAAGRLLKLYVELRHARGDAQVAYCEVQANKAMQPVGFSVVQGKSYRVRALGRWRLSPRIECNADGTNQMPAAFYGPTGALLINVVKSPPEYKITKVGSDVTWAAPLSGGVWFTISDTKIGDPAGKDAYSGSLHVLIERVD